MDLKKQKKVNLKKKKGFTLIEVVAVIAIICILAIVMLPKFGGYITQAKKLAVVAQCRKVVMAAECANMKADNSIGEEASVKDIKDNKVASQYLQGEGLDKLTDGVTLAQCRSIVNGGEFDITNGVFSSGGIVDSGANKTDKDNKKTDASGGAVVPKKP